MSFVPPVPSDAEFGILMILWRRGPSTVREVHDAIGKDTGYTSTLKQNAGDARKGPPETYRRRRVRMSMKPRFRKIQPMPASPGQLPRPCFRGLHSGFARRTTRRTAPPLPNPMRSAAYP